MNDLIGNITVAPEAEAYRPFPKIPRLRQTVTITEKIDGTNACVRVYGDGTVRAGSRTRWITPESDNFGFAKWVQENQEELRKLGEGWHFGEWWGPGIQRGYGLTERRFSLFNVHRWGPHNPNTPSCCHVVPHLVTEAFYGNLVDWAIGILAREGSVAAPGFMKPEGVIVYHHASKTYYKRLIENDDIPKSLVA